MVYGIVRQTEGFIKVDSEVGRGTTFSIHLPRFESDAEEGETLDSKEVVTGKDGTPIITVQEKIAAPVTINQKILLGLNVSNAIDRSHTRRLRKLKTLGFFLLKTKIRSELSVFGHLRKKAMRSLVAIRPKTPWTIWKKTPISIC